MLEELTRRGLSEGSVKRYRASLSSFFGWCVREKYIQHNRVTSTKVPRSSDEPMLPFTEEELEVAWPRWSERNRRLGRPSPTASWASWKPCPWARVRPTCSARPTKARRCTGAPS